MLVEHADADDADIDPPLIRQPFEGRYAVLAAIVRARRCVIVDSMAVEGGPTIPYDTTAAGGGFCFWIWTRQRYRRTSDRREHHTEKNESIDSQTKPRNYDK